MQRTKTGTGAVKSCEALATLRSFGYFRDMSTVEEIEHAVERLPRKEFARLAAWIGQHQTGAAEYAQGHGPKSGAEWFDVYMACPHSFKIPPRKKQLYRPKT